MVYFPCHIPLDLNPFNFIKAILSLKTLDIIQTKETNQFPFSSFWSHKFYTVSRYDPSQLLNKCVWSSYAKNQIQFLIANYFRFIVRKLSMFCVHFLFSLMNKFFWLFKLYLSFKERIILFIILRKTSKFNFTLQFQYGMERRWFSVW